MPALPKPSQRGAAIAGPQFDRADVSQPAAAGSGCESPDRPPEGVSPERWQMFLDAVDAFRACIDHRVESHQQAAAFHSAAARRAVDEWNLFVRHSLNAPEDFPFPPQASDDREPADPRQQVISGNWDGRALKDQF